MTNQQQPLITKESVALSLAPPRTPPSDSVIRNLYTNPRSAAQLYNLLTNARNDFDVENPNRANHDSHKTSSYESHNLQSRFLQLLQDGNHLLHHSIHPHMPSSLSLPDQLIRFIGRTLSLESQHRYRDNGTFRGIADGMVKLTCPLIGLGNLHLAHEFLNLSSTKRMRRIRYGEHHPMQYIDLFLPENDIMRQRTQTPAKRGNKIPVRGTLFFVHGGAWGAGHPWMYRLVAPAFLKRNFAVAIVGYRTYPDAATIDTQVDDIRLAFEELDDVLNEWVMVIPDRFDVTNSIGNKDNNWVGNVIMGHSSGAHIALLLLIDMISDRMKSSSSTEKESNRYPWSLPHYFVGLSGPYDISDHFDFEAGRGVEQISPMNAICGFTRANFDRASPTKRLLSNLTSFDENSTAYSSGIKKVALEQIVPPMLLVHGIEDATVPFTATSDAARRLKCCGLTKCDEIYLEKTGHQDVIMQFMMSGPAMDAVFDWLFEYRSQPKVDVERRVKMQSRL